jgi:DNA-binding transcriptional MerR regulator/mannose-6-phosphate isomerase-like protein (cupin superfamily)
VSKAFASQPDRNGRAGNREPSVEGNGKALKVSDAAQRLGVSAAMLRSLENLGLARPSRNQSRYRLYTDDDVRVLRRAIYLRRVQRLSPRAIQSRLEEEGLLNGRDSSHAKEEASLVPRLRTLRLLHGKSLSSVADAVGVSEGFLSNLERARNVASGALLKKLARYYGIEISDLINPIEATGPLVRRQDRKKLRSGPGVHVEMLASGNISMEPHLFQLAPQAGSRAFCSHDGEHFLYVVRGRLNIGLGHQQFDLRAGDSFYLNSNLEHRWSNPGKGQTVILIVSTPPSF